MLNGRPEHIMVKFQRLNSCDQTFYYYLVSLVTSLIPRCYFNSGNYCHLIQYCIYRLIVKMQVHKGLCIQRVYKGLCIQSYDIFFIKKVPGYEAPVCLEASAEETERGELKYA